MDLLPTSFTPEELRAVLAAYDLGKASQAEIFRAGSPKSPKVIIRTERGNYLVKRRAPGRDDPFKVAFAHELQVQLRAKQFPLPHLQGTKENQNTMLQMNGTVYEVFEYLPSSSFDYTPPAARDAGRVLGLYHKLLANYKAKFTPPQGSIHNNPDVARVLASRLKIIKGAGGESLDDLRAVFGALLTLYHEGAARSDALGVASWPMQITHADWHPSNLLYVEHVVVGVIDFDGARMQQRIIDLANGLVQFCTTFDKKLDPSKWPAEVNLPLFQAFVAGYDSVNVLSSKELLALPHVMAESIIAEPVLAAQAARNIEELAPFIPWLVMAKNKALWLSDNRKAVLHSLSELLLPGA